MGGIISGFIDIIFQWRHGLALPCLEDTEYSHAPKDSYDDKFANYDLGYQLIHSKSLFGPTDRFRLTSGKRESFFRHIDTLILSDTEIRANKSSPYLAEAVLQGTNLSTASTMVAELMVFHYHVINDITSLIPTIMGISLGNHGCLSKPCALNASN